MNKSLISIFAHLIDIHFSKKLKGPCFLRVQYWLTKFSKGDVSFESKALSAYKEHRFLN